MRGLVVISNRHIRNSCYVFVERGEIPLLAGRYMIDEHGLGHFTYGKSYLENPLAFPLDPINLPFTDPPQIFHPINGKESFGVLSDSTPDNWGRKLIASIHRSSPQNEVEWLLASRGNGVGCIVANAAQSAPQRKKPLHSLSDIEAFFAMADSFEAGKTIPEELVHLAEFGSSMGGLRPKLTITHEGKEWIAKINRIDDKFDVSTVEYATMQMAKKTGIIIPNMQLRKISGRTILLVERFDRNVPSKKLHYISAHSLINAHRINVKDTAKNYSYMGIADIAKRITADPQGEQVQLYRRMVFNTLTGNTDDHMKNHGFLMTDYKKKLYGLSPAFDILPHLDAPQHLQSIGVGEYGREASIENLLSAYGRFGVSEKQAREILQEVQEVVKDWQIYYEKIGVVERDIAILKGCFSIVM
jgi:serine/threonine-protein kinase HipA